MRAWILTIPLLPALDALCGCVFLPRDAYPRTCQRWVDVASPAAIVGLRTWGVLALRGG